MEKQRVVTFCLSLYFPATAWDTFCGRVMGRKGSHTWLEHVIGYWFSLAIADVQPDTLPGPLRVSRLGECPCLKFQVHLKAPWSFSSIGTLP